MTDDRTPSNAAAPSVDAAEISRFAGLASTWWNARGPMAPLHKLNPTRLAWFKKEIAARFGRDAKSATAFAGLSVLDIGSGGGLVAEPFARMGARVVGIDPTADLIAAARHHAAAAGVAVDYRETTAEALVAAGEQFDVVLALEVVEHVTDVDAFVATAGRLVKPGGLMIASTINRTLRAFALAIIGAEYVLRWLPRGTHSYDKLVTPEELRTAFLGAGLFPAVETGVMYVPIVDEFRLTRDLGVNYMMTATRG